MGDVGGHRGQLRPGDEGPSGVRGQQPPGQGWLGRAWRLQRHQGELLRRAHVLGPRAGPPPPAMPCTSLGGRRGRSPPPHTGSLAPAWPHSQTSLPTHRPRHRHHHPAWRPLAPLPERLSAQGLQAAGAWGGAACPAARPGQRDNETNTAPHAGGCWGSAQTPGEEAGPACPSWGEM